MSSLDEPVNLDEVIRMGHIAQQFIDNPDVKALLELVRDRIRHEWEQAKQPLERENLHAEIRALARFEMELVSAVNAGEHARMDRDRHPRRTD